MIINLIQFNKILITSFIKSSSNSCRKINKNKCGLEKNTLLHLMIKKNLFLLFIFYFINLYQSLTIESSYCNSVILRYLNS